MALGDLALGDPDIARDPALADDRVIAARRLPVLGSVVEQDSVDLRPVVEAEIHAVEEGSGALPTARGPLLATRCSAVASQPLSTEDRIGIEDRPGRPHRQHVWPLVCRTSCRTARSAGGVPSPPACAASWSSGRPLRVADDPELLGDQGAPHVGADVRGGCLHAAGAIGAETVGRQPGFGSVIATNDAHVSAHSGAAFGNRQGPPGPAKRRPPHAP